MIRTNCLSCNASNLKEIINLGEQPWCNDFRIKEQVDLEKLNIYPLTLMMCEVCSLLQLNYFVPKERMFKNHTYLSGTTKSLSLHFYNLAKENFHQFNLQKNDLIVDIGGNDGTQLLQYKKHGLENLLNVESANNIAEISKKNEIPTLNDYFNESLVSKIPGKAKLINASGVFFHLEELHSVLKGIKILLDKNGIFVVQFMYAKSIIESGSFDAIYHEHLCYYTIKSISYLLSQYGIEIFDAYFSDIHSGSMIIKCCHRDSLINIPTKRFDDAYKKELIEFGPEKIIEFCKKTKDFKKVLYDKIMELNVFNKKIYCLGAPAKGNTLLNYCNLNNNLIEKVFETNDLKVGRYTPGTNIPIVKEDLNDLPDYFLLLSHNFLKEIKKKFENTNVKFIVPFYNNKLIEII